MDEDFGCGWIPPNSPADGFSSPLFSHERVFASFLRRKNLHGKVVEIGTGSGVLALAAARAGARNVLAIDINPHAAKAAAENARLNGLTQQVTALCSNLMYAVDSRPLFDIILSSPPSFAGEPCDLADRAWHAGPDYRDIAELFDQAYERLAPEGRIYLLLSTDSHLELLGRLIEKAGFRKRLVAKRSLLIESLIIYELWAHQLRPVLRKKRSSFEVSDYLRSRAASALPVEGCVLIIDLEKLRLAL